MSASKIKHNIFANFLGNVWTTLMALAFIPLYIHFMGIEAYGLVGVFVSLQALFVLLDLGLQPTVNRELARLSVLRDNAQEMRHLVRTLELIYWAVAVIIGLSVILLAPVLAHHWLKATHLSPTTVQQALMIMGLVIAFRWPQGFYAGGLLGLQRQVLLNSVLMVMSGLGGAGAILILWLVSPTIQAFFCWQLLVSVLHTLILAGFLWHRLPPAPARPSFQKGILAGVWRFAAGMSGNSFTALILTQLDKIILSKLLTLEMFGYYTLAVTVAFSLYRFIYAISQALYPRFTQLASLGDQEKLRRLYHQGCQLVSVLIFPVGLTMAFFSEEILILWTRNSLTVQNTHLLVSLLVVGTGLNSLLHLPYILQLAFGWTTLALLTNIVFIILLTPLLFLLTSQYGAVGAALVWLALNVAYVIIWPQIMHRRLLKGDQWRWYREDVGLPLAAALLVVGMGRWLWPGQLPPVLMLACLALVGTLALAAAALAAPQIRGQLLELAYQTKMFYATRYARSIK